jgi:hypothetical protein
LADTSATGTVGEVYNELIAEHLERQAKRKASIEQRGLAVISTSGALVTLQFALVAVITDQDSFSLTGPERTVLGLSLLAFVAAAVLGLLTNITRSYAYVSTRQLEELTRPTSWQGSRSEAQRRIARVRVRMLRSARTNNGAKAKLLRYAIATEVAAVAFLAVCVALILV